MSKLTKAEAERIARAFWKAEKTPAIGRPAPRRAPLAEKLATEWLQRTGFDLKRARRLHEQHRAEWDRQAPKAAARAARSWAGQIRRTQRSATAWATEAIALGGGAPPSASFFVDTPVGFFASDPKSLTDSHIEAGKSFAKVLVDRRRGNVDTYSFIFGFHNGAATPFLFNFDTLLNVSGHVGMSVGGGFFNGGELVAEARLDVLAGNQISDTQGIAFVGAISDGPPFFGGSSNERTLSLTRFLTVPGVVLQPDSLAVLLVSLVLRSDLDDAHVVADFSTGNFRALCPVVFVSRSPLPLKASGLTATAGLTL